MAVLEYFPGSTEEGLQVEGEDGGLKPENASAYTVERFGVQGKTFRRTDKIPSGNIPKKQVVNSSVAGADDFTT